VLATHTGFGEISRDLELDALYHTINHTQTNCGNNSLRSLLAQPITDLSTLQSRQAAIGNIAHNTKLQKQLTSLLKAFNNQEASFQQILQPASTIEHAALENFYFSSSYCKKWNYSPAYLELGLVAYFGNLCSSMVQHALALAIFTWALEEEHVCASHPKKHKEEHGHKHTEDHACPSHPKKHKEDHGHKHAEGHTCADHPKKHKEDHGHKHAEGHLCADHPKEHNEDHGHKHDNAEKQIFDQSCNHASHLPKTAFQLLFKSEDFKYAFQVWHTIAQIQELYSIQSIVRSDMECIKQLQVQLMDLARGIKISKHIHTILTNHPELTSNLPHYQDLENICNGSNLSKKLTLLLALLQTPTFKGKESVFSRVGIILAAYNIAQEIGYQLKPLLNAIGEIDAYVSCAQLLNQHKTSAYHYSFAQYITDSHTPFLNAHNFWHPLVTTPNIQLNSIAIGMDTNPRNIILTGPNSCGKSTNVKALTLCAYLAQTITLVPAEKYSQTIYKEIYSSMVVADKIEENLSLFVTELTNAEQLLEKVEALAKDEYMVIALDELFKSTHHEKGQLIAQRLLEQLHRSPQVITLVSTHFEKLTTLESTYNGNCANYTVNNFILEPGVGSPENSFDLVTARTTSRLLY